MPKIEVLPHSHADGYYLRVDGDAVNVSLDTDGVRVEYPDRAGGAVSRVVTWAAVLAAPKGYGVLRNGWHVETVATEADAIDRVNELRSHGDAASYFRIAH